MKLLIIGCGEQGSTIARYLVDKADVDEVRLADIDLKRADKLADTLKSSKVFTRRVDAGNIEEVSKVAEEIDVVVNATLPRFDLSIMEAAIKAGSNYVDMASGPPYVIDEQIAQDEEWRKAGLTALISTGISPGVTNVLIARAADQLDSVEEILIRSATKILPGTRVYEGKELFLETWSPETMWLDFAEPPVIFENGEWKTAPLFGGEEVYTFPEPLGPCTVVYHAHEEVHTVPHFIKGVKKMNMKIGLQPALFMAKAVMELGLLSDKPVEVKGVEVAPRDVFFKLTKPIPTIDELARKIEADVLLETVGATVIEVKGEKVGVKTSYKYFPATPPMTLREAYKKYGRSFLERPGIVGTSCAVFTHMLGAGRIRTKGVIPPEGLTRDERDIFLSELTKRGFVFEEVVERSLS